MSDLQNLGEHSLVNGSLGTIVSFDTSYDAASHHIEVARPDKGFVNEADMAAVRQVVEPDLSRKKEDTPPESKDASNRIDTKEPEDRPKRDNTRWPVVRFTNGEIRQIVPHNFEAVNSIGRIEATRSQVGGSSTMTRMPR